MVATPEEMQVQKQLMDARGTGRNTSAWESSPTNSSLLQLSPISTQMVAAFAQLT